MTVKEKTYKIHKNIILPKIAHSPVVTFVHSKNVVETIYVALAVNAKAIRNNKLT